MDVKIIVDPMGNEVHLPPAFTKMAHANDSLDEDYSLAFSMPALIIMPTSSMKNLYHLRAVGWGATILFKSEWQGYFWMVTECLHNPDIYFIRTLLQSGNAVSFNR